MILERPLLNRLSVRVPLSAYGAGIYGASAFGEDIVDDLVPFLTEIRVRRGGERDGLGVKADVGLMTLTMNDLYDPLTSPFLAPQQPVSLTVDNAVIFTGVIASLGAAYPLDKQTGTYRTVTTVTVADAVADHGKTPRYGVRAPEGYETFEDRIARLAVSARTPVEAPTRYAPREVYAL